MNTEIEGRKLGTAFDFPLQWGSRKRLRGPKAVNGSVGGVSVSGLFTKPFRVGGRVVRTDKQASRQHKPSQGDSTKSCDPDFDKMSKRFSDVSSDRLERSCEPVESSAVGRVDTNAFPLRNKSDEVDHFPVRAYDLLLAGDPPQGCTPVSGVEEESHQNLELLILPKFLISLSRKEKEEDFLAIKGSKLPPRPKKRAKHIQRLLHNISPGSWLCELTLDRYEVSEKSSMNKRPQGLKAMSSLDSDSA